MGNQGTRDWLERVAPTARPLFRRIGQRGGAAFGRRPGIDASGQQVNNWKRRGVPEAKIGRIASELGITYEQYMQEAGLSTGKKVQQTSSQYTLDRVALINDFEALPTWLQEHIARKAAELRAYAESLPAYVREGMKAPPKDPDAYRAWERNIESDMANRVGAGGEDKARPPSTEKRFPIGESPTPSRRSTSEKKVKR